MHCYNVWDVRVFGAFKYEVRLAKISLVHNANVNDECECDNKSKT